MASGWDEDLNGTDDLYWLLFISYLSFCSFAIPFSFRQALVEISTKCDGSLSGRASSSLESFPGYGPEKAVDGIWDNSRREDNRRLMPYWSSKTPIAPRVPVLWYFDFPNATTVRRLRVYLSYCGAIQSVAIFGFDRCGSHASKIRKLTSTDRSVRNLCTVG